MMTYTKTTNKHDIKYSIKLADNTDYKNLSRYHFNTNIPSTLNYIIWFGHNDIEEKQGIVIERINMCSNNGIDIIQLIKSLDKIANDAVNKYFNNDEIDDSSYYIQED